MHRHRFPTRAAARMAIFEFIEVFYNRKMISPAEFERRLREERQEATVA